MRETVRIRLLFVGAALATALGTSACMTAYKKSVGANTQSNYSRVYTTDFNTAWQAVLDTMKSIRLDVTNREAGFLQSRWMDNTKEKNFSDGDGSTAPYMKAQYRFKVSIAKGVYRGIHAVKVTVQREQFAQRDALDDFRALESDSIEENTLLYRIGRVIAVRTRLARLEERQTRMQIQQAGDAVSPDLPPPMPEASPGDSPVDDSFIPDPPPEN